MIEDETGGHLVYFEKMNLIQSAIMNLFHSSNINLVDFRIMNLFYSPEMDLSHLIKRDFFTTARISFFYSNTIGEDGFLMILALQINFACFPCSFCKTTEDLVWVPTPSCSR